MKHTKKGKGKYLNSREVIKAKRCADCNWILSHNNKTGLCSDCYNQSLNQQRCSNCGFTNSYKKGEYQSREQALCKKCHHTLSVNSWFAYSLQFSAIEEKLKKAKYVKIIKEEGFRIDVSNWNIVKLNNFIIKNNIKNYDFEFATNDKINEKIILVMKESIEKYI